MSGRSALARCVGDVDAFLAHAWGRRPHHHEAPEGYAGLLSLDDVDRVVASSGLRTPGFRLVRDGATLDPRSFTRRARIGSRPVSDLADPGRVYALFAEGATIVLQGLQRSWPPLARFCRALEAVLTHPVQANAYVTPPVAAGLRVHADEHDVFALHTHGAKQWCTYPAAGDEPDRDLVLRAGACLYLPRGTRHAARTVDEASVHITIGVRTITWEQVLRRAVDGALNAVLAGDPGRLPAGFADDPEVLHAGLAERLRHLGEEVAAQSAGEVAAAEAARFWESRPPLLEGQLGQVLRLAQGIDDRTQVVRRPGTACRVDDGDGDGDVRLVLGDRALRMPGRARTAARWVAAQERFAVGDLAHLLDEEGRRVLVGRLVREALLMIES